MLLKRWIPLLMALCLILVLVAACGGDDDSTPTTTTTSTSTPTTSATETPEETSTPSPEGAVKIGVLHDWSGAWAISGTFYMDRLIKLIEKQVKDEGGILGGREVELVKYDGGSTVSGMQTAAKKAFYDGMPVLVEGGTMSINGQVISDFAEENHVLFCDLIIMPYDVSNLKYTVHAGYRLEDTLLQAKYAIEVLKGKKYAILGRALEESRHFADLWVDMIEESGGEVVYKDFPPAGTDDMSPYLTQIKYKGPDVLLTDLETPNYASMAAQIGGLGGWDGMKVICNMAAAYSASKPGADGWVVFARWVPGLDYPGADKFEQDYKAMYKSDPEGAMELMYEPVWLGIEAIKLAGTDTDREAIAQAARSGNLGWETPLGYVKWGTDGEPVVKIQLLCEIKDKTLVPVPDWQ